MDLTEKEVLQLWTREEQMQGSQRWCRARQAAPASGVPPQPLGNIPQRRKPGAQNFSKHGQQRPQLSPGTLSCELKTQGPPRKHSQTGTGACTDGSWATRHSQG